MPTREGRTRLSIDVPSEMRRRIRLAAAGRDQSIREYVWQAINTKLDQDAPSAMEGRIRKGSTLTERADPVLADLCKNAKDADYDDL